MNDDGAEVRELRGDNHRSGRGDIGNVLAQEVAAPTGADLNPLTLTLSPQSGIEGNSNSALPEGTAFSLAILP